MNLRHTPANLLATLLLLGLLAATLLLYWPGLSGSFILDDTLNLEPLKDFQGIQDFEEAARFALSGTSGPSGRPLSLISFLINDNAWPSNPWGFKYTNLLLHLLNGVVLYWLLLRVFRLLGAPPGRPEFGALAVAALWLLHPLNVSTVLYVVQRMTELSALFTFAGLLAYVHGRERVDHAPLRAYLWMSAGIGLGTALATLSKENGILLPLYALIIELVVFPRRPVQTPRLWKAWRAVFLILPLLLSVAYVALHTDSYLHTYATRRDFTATERLLTETRILFDYLAQILVPRLSGSGLFHEDYPLSRGLLDPPQTLAATGSIIALLVASVVLRRRLPALSLGILWFFAGHVLESTFIPLELYFEHRNYLPMIGPLLAVCYYVTALPTQPRMLAGLSGALILFGLLLAFLTAQRSQLWGNPTLLAETWSKENPSSTRAQQWAANYWILARDDPDTAIARLETALSHAPGHSGTRLQLLQLYCLQDTVTRPRIETAIRGLDQAEYDGATAETVKKLAALQADEACPPLARDDIHRMLESLIDNPRYQRANILANLYFLRGHLYAAERKLDPAMRSLDKAFEYRPDVDIRLRQALWLASAGLYDQALEFVAEAEQLDRQRIWPFGGARQDTIAEVRNAIQDAKRGTGAARLELPSPTADP